MTEKQTYLAQMELQESMLVTCKQLRDFDSMRAVYLELSRLSGCVVLAEQTEQEALKGN